jgi:hypothetical protein
VSEGKNTDELMGWIDNHCRQHQGDDLHTASEAFIDDFRQRNHRGGGREPKLVTRS